MLKFKLPIHDNFFLHSHRQDSHRHSVRLIFFSQMVAINPIHYYHLVLSLGGCSSTQRCPNVLGLLCLWEYSGLKALELISLREDLVTISSLFRFSWSSGLHISYIHDSAGQLFLLVWALIWERMSLPSI